MIAPSVADRDVSHRGGTAVADVGSSALSQSQPHGEMTQAPGETCPLRILVVQPTADKRGHYGVWTAAMCQALAGQGCDVTLCTNVASADKYLDEKPRFRVHSAGAERYSFGKFDDAVTSHPLYYYYGYFRNSYIVTAAALKLCRQQRFDIVFITDAEFLTASLLLQRHRALSLPVVMHVNAPNFTFDTYCGSFLKKVYKVFQREVFKTTLGRHIKALIVLGDWHKQRLAEQLGLRQDFPIEVVSDSGTDAPQDNVDKSQARRRLGIDYDGKLLLFFGMLRKDKNIETLFEAVSLASSNGFKLLVAGSLMDYTREQVTAMVRSRRVCEKVILKLEYIPDGEVPVYFSACDALVLPYGRIYAGGSGPLFKGACTHRRPAIVTNVSEMGRLVADHKMGLVAEPENAASLAAKITEFVNLPQAERERMAENSFELGRSNSWEETARRYVRFYRSLTQNATA